MIEKKTTRIIHQLHEMNNYSDEDLAEKEWVSVESLFNEGIDMETSLGTDGSDNPEQLVDGIFIPLSWLSRGE